MDFDGLTASIDNSLSYFKKVPLERKYQYEMQDNQSDNKVSRVESYNSKVPVENLVDPKTITFKEADIKELELMSS